MTELSDTHPGCGDMVERVARVLFEKTRATESRLTWGDLTPGQPDHAGWMGMAQAAITAMRKPTEAMAEAGHEEIPDNRGYVNDAVAVFRAMIDAALSPQHKPVKLSERSNTDPSPTQA